MSLTFDEIMPVVPDLNEILVLAKASNNSKVRCRVTSEVLEDHYNETLQNISGGTRSDLENRWSNLYSKRMYQRPGDSFDGVDVLLTTSNFAASN